MYCMFPSPLPSLRQNLCPTTVHHVTPHIWQSTLKCRPPATSSTTAMSRAGSPLLHSTDFSHIHALYKHTQFVSALAAVCPPPSPPSSTALAQARACLPSSPPASTPELEQDEHDAMSRLSPTPSPPPCRVEPAQTTPDMAPPQCHLERVGSSNHMRPNWTPRQQKPRNHSATRRETKMRRRTMGAGISPLPRSRSMRTRPENQSKRRVRGPAQSAGSHDMMTRRKKRTQHDVASFYELDNSGHRRQVPTT